MSHLTRDDAKKIIQDVRVDNGGITPEERAATLPSVLRALDNVRSKLGASTRTLSANLYSKDTRFVYELIQNAEDNRYTKAGSDPFLTFTLYPEKVIVDSNEDGFQEEHIRAICSIGESTKANVQGYIGEKGIGFKSVFKVAKRVHIQSEPFSFAFNYEPNLVTKADDNNDALGMITPMEEGFDSLPQDVQTRMTLSLKEASKTEKWLGDLLNISGALLMFLNQLKVIQINNQMPNQDIISTRYAYSFDAVKSIATVTRTVMRSTQGSTIEPDLYHVVKNKVNNLPLDEFRSNSGEATIILAFPVNSSDRPVLRSQLVYAYLPLQDVGFKFLIQADFVTQGNREGIFDSERNRKILDGVADTFLKAVHRFCEHPTLVHDWIQYLPSDEIADDFWKRLRPKIIALVMNARVIRSRSESKLYTPGELRILPNVCLDKNFEPLLADLHGRECYVSSKYGNLDTIRNLGVQIVNWTELIDRVEADLVSSSSRIKGGSMDEDWRTRTAELLSMPFKDPTKSLIHCDQIRKLSIIPLDSRSWVSTQMLPIYFPTTGNSSIPTDLGFRLVTSESAANAAQVRFLQYLGVTRCATRTIIATIYECYKGGFGIPAPKLTSEHLHFLWDNPQKSDTDVNVKIWVRSEAGKSIWLAGPKKEHMYFSSSDDYYSPKSLLKTGDSLPEGVHFVDPAIITLSTDRTNNGKTFEQWLEETMGIKTVPHLLHHSRDDISNEFAHIIKHRPGDVVGTLKAHWNAYKPHITTPSVRDALRQCAVPADGGAQHIALGSSYLPSPKLKAIVTEAGIDPGRIFFLAPSQVRDEELLGWNFLHSLGVGTEDDLGFYLNLLRLEILRENSVVPQQVLPLYTKISEHCLTPAGAERTRTLFQHHGLIFLPELHHSNDSKWCYPRQCVWTGPTWLTTKHIVEPQYKNLEHFFKHVLQAHDYSWRDGILELDDMKRRGTEDSIKVCSIYERLKQDFQHHSSWEELKSELESKGLIFVPGTHTWYSPSSCIWARNGVRIPGKQSIATCYASLSEFFENMLGVTRPDLQMHVQGLKDLDKIQKKDDQWFNQVKDMMMLISSMDPDGKALSQLRTANIFPVRIGQGLRRPTHSQVEFAIVDRPEMEGLFGDIAVLDIPLQELRKYKQFLYAMGLSKRFMSVLVQENTSVAGGELDFKLTDFLRSRAAPLFRCALHFNSVKARADDQLFHRLNQSRTYLSDSISKCLTITQNSQDHRVEQQAANFHLEDHADKLNLYVPKDGDNRELCYFTHLPKRIMQFLAISDPAAESIINSIVNSSQLSIVEAILRNAGVVETFEVELPPVLLNEDSENGAIERTPASVASTLEAPDLGRGTALGEHRTSESRSNLFAESGRSLSRSASPDASSNTAWSTPSSGDQRGVLSPSTPFSFRSTSQLEIAPAPLVQTNKYTELLARVIAAASRITIPQHGTSAFSEIPGVGAEYMEAIFGYRSPDRDTKVGAAGELFVFELLQNLGLPEFGRSNWKSTIRKEVQVHNAYRYLEPWNGRETADIVYDDSQSKLIPLLITKGYLAGIDAGLATDNLKCYIEVKTTTGDFDEPFFMSSAQYDRMEALRDPIGSGKNAVYIVMRVFNLERNRIGLRVFVDPIVAKERGELEFKVDTWKVKPTTGN